MPVVIRCVGLRGTQRNKGAPPVGDYLQHYDPDYLKGDGIAFWTDKRALAMQFKTALDAMALYKAVSRYRPALPDGTPNCPLMAYDILIEGVSP